MKITKSNAMLMVAATLSVVTMVACGGGGDGSSTPAAATSTPASSATPASGASATSTSQPGTLDTSNYAAGTSERAAFDLINQYRTQCGFPALKQNTVLDQASRNHVAYEIANNVVSDTEVAGKAGFTGVTGADRAKALGWPSGVYVGAADDGVSNVIDPTVIGHNAILGFMSVPYHSLTVPINSTDIGIAFASDQNGSTVSLHAGGTLATIAGAPLTLPCQGSTGIPYQGNGENPTPPGVTWPVGTPIAVMSNLNDIVRLTSGTITGPDGTPIMLQLLDGSIDPTIGNYEAVAYPKTPLKASTQYSVMLQGTVNGTQFTRAFSFTTGTFGA
ncbi:CAP domain-containing protein [Burkholderia glumae]|uniref:CAP domain-containing protein n=1 Tax=Burkholderia glumae TaxID=337 RepID=UPI002036797D|nr:CAP domain-containing protein [Burkholderia glumae]MCM2552674.1 CAP domain-containing protein [Burkholderia glumae]MCQ0031459.1 CAP domain-containing protein [Burkholderia glumae]MCQ0035111.1 CAP domain-containing protein [Burkholderia glumae]